MPDIDFDLWKEWDAHGRRKKDIVPILGRFEPLVEKNVSLYHRVNIPEATIRAKAQMNVVDAIQTFNPKQGVKLNTHVNWHMQKLKRFVTSHQNFARIPEPMVYRIGEYNLAARELGNKLGRDPSIMELADELKWPQKHVERMRKVLRKDLSASIYESDPQAMRESRWAEVKALVPYELDAQTNAVFEKIFKSPQPMTDTQLAMKLRMTPGQVSKARHKISDTINLYMGGI